MYFGRVTEEKGVDTVVKAYEMMPDRHVKIMGDDTTDEAKRLKAYIKEKNIKNVEFLGFKAGEELEEIIKGARFTLIPSIWYDNLPNTALVEKMGAASRARLEDRFAPQTHYDTLMRIFESVRRK